MSPQPQPSGSNAPSPITNSDASLPVLGCIADDVTGATDLALNLVQGGMRVVQFLGVPTRQEMQHAEADAFVVALKTRSVAASEAVRESKSALDALRNHGIQHFFFKYCSTFDSTREGNIGPVAEALMAAVDQDQTLFCPAFPQAGRTVYQGHLFVFEQLLSESGMATHPLNPMSDSNLVRFLSEQTRRNVGLLPYSKINAGHASILAHLRELRERNADLVIADSCDEDHLEMLATALCDHALLTGGSGIARYLPLAYRKTGQLRGTGFAPKFPSVAGRALILAGSCSTATNAQVAHMREKCPTAQVEISSILHDPHAALQKTLEWARNSDPSQPLLVYSTAEPEDVQKAQAQFGTETVAGAIEEHLSELACNLIQQLAIRRLIVAGGETSGAVVNALGIRALRIGAEICPGVPWTESLGGSPLALALKSGNFGEPDFFERALAALD